jgi:predicted amidohydrolase
MKVACIQPRILKTRKECYNHIETLLSALVKEHKSCVIACLPEKWVPFFNNLPENIQEERGKDYLFIKEMAIKYGICLLSGAIWEKRKNSKKPKITCYFFNNKGEEVGRQDKIHLYNSERINFEPGRVLNIFKLNESKFAILICFDIAFYETPRLAAENGADLLFSPTQIKEEGMHNWNVYLQARALENRIPVVASNTFGEIFGRRFLGNSKIISFVKGYTSPSKLEIIEAPIGSSGYIYADIDLNYAKKLRKIRLKEKVDPSKIKIVKCY